MKEKINGIINYVGGDCKIGDVLEKFREKAQIENYRYSFSDHYVDVGNLWVRFGFTKSLQEIFSGEIEVITYEDTEQSYQTGSLITFDREEFKNKETQALLAFLWDIFKDKIK